MRTRNTLDTFGLRFVAPWLAVAFASLPTHAQLVTHDWPTGPGQAKLSTHYRVWAQVGDGPEKEIEVLQSDAIFEGGKYIDGEAADLRGRTFSLASIGYDPAGGRLKLRAEKILGEPAEAVTLSPRSYTLTARLSKDRRGATFAIDQPRRYLAIDFQSPDNRTVSHQWIKHMLCVFVDPVETETPVASKPGVVAYSPKASAESLSKAKVIVFPAGYHNLKHAALPGVIEGEGGLVLRHGQSAYLASGAFVEGHITHRGDQQRVFGRGVLTGRQYTWDKTVRRSFIDLGNEAIVQGVMIMEAPLHGVVCGSKSLLEDIKFVGWHWNNDGFRPGWNSIVRHCFMRCADDFFYNFALDVSDVVLWPAHNGSIMTFGWGNYTTGGSLLHDVDIIHPEWVSLQNNNGLIMSQTDYDFRANGETTTFRDIRIEGSIPGLFNLKPRADQKPLPANRSDRLGYVGDVLLEDITVDDQYGRGVIHGAKGAVAGGDSAPQETKWLVKNITVRNVTIGGVCLDESTKDNFIKIDPDTTQNLRFEACPAQSVE